MTLLDQFGDHHRDACRVQARAHLERREPERLARVADRRQHIDEVLGVRLGRIDEVLLDLAVVRVEQQDPARRLAVAAGAADLLIIRGHRSRHVDVDHISQVRLVDAHAERVGRGDRRVATGEEVGLQLALVLGLEAGVVGRRRQATTT